MCRHRGCRCDAREDGFCSDACAAHVAEHGSAAHECVCGHDECATGPGAECAYTG
jgi:hypothetical protein